MNPDTLRAAAAIIDARAAHGHPEWKRIADELTHGQAADADLTKALERALDLAEQWESTEPETVMTRRWAAAVLRDVLT